MIKAVVLLRRPARWTRERFHRWWLDEHVAYGKKLPDLRKYRVHGHRIDLARGPRAVGWIAATAWC
jgi:hypothetical protein